MAEVAEDIVDHILMDDAFQVADDEAGKHPADLRVLVGEDLLNIKLERGIGLVHVGWVWGCKDKHGEKEAIGSRQ